jgi:hypothetical protein
MVGHFKGNAVLASTDYDEISGLGGSSQAKPAPAALLSLRAPLARGQGSEAVLLFPSSCHGVLAVKGS